MVAASQGGLLDALWAGALGRARGRVFCVGFLPSEVFRGVSAEVRSCWTRREQAPALLRGLGVEVLLTLMGKDQPWLLLTHQSHTWERAAAENCLVLVLWGRILTSST